MVDPALAAAAGAAGKSSICMMESAGGEAQHGFTHANGPSIQNSIAGINPASWNSCGDVGLHPFPPVC